MLFKSKKFLFILFIILAAITISLICIFKKDNIKSQEFDYGKLKLYESKSIEELTNINGGVEPYREPSLYIGKISNDKVNDVYDVIAQLNILKDLYGINDSRFEFVPGMYISDKSYRVHQVYNGVEVWCSQTNVSIDNEGYISSLVINYVDGLEEMNISTTPEMSEKECKNIIKKYSKAKKYDDWDFYLAILSEKEPILMYYVDVNIDNKDYNFWINAISGEIISVSEVQDVY